VAQAKKHINKYYMNNGEPFRNLGIKVPEDGLKKVP